MVGLSSPAERNGINSTVEESLARRTVKSWSAGTEQSGGRSPESGGSARAGDHQHGQFLRKPAMQLAAIAELTSPVLGLGNADDTNTSRRWSSLTDSAPRSCGAILTRYRFCCVSGAACGSSVSSVPGPAH